MTKEIVQNNSGLVPYHNKVLMRTEAPKGITETGIHLVDEKPDSSAVIVAIGEDTFEGWKAPPKVGDRVLHFGAIQVKIGPDKEIYTLADCDKIALRVTDNNKIATFKTPPPIV